MLGLERVVRADVLVAFVPAEVGEVTVMDEVL